MLITRPSLLKRLRQPGDQKSWEEFVKLYTPLLLHWARRAGVQDDASRSFRAWLKTILMNILRKRQPPTGPLVVEVPAPDPRIEIENEEDRQRLLARALELMQTDFAANTWKSFCECVVNGRPAAEVAEELGITVGAVWVNVSRVRARLRAEFAGLLD